MNDEKFSACKFSAGIVPYMYGELARQESSAFESHLLACSDCTDEFAAIAAARYEVYEWKKVEFEPLATPLFEIPRETFVASLSWSEKLRMAFTHGWAAPGFALAGIVLVAVAIGLFVLADSSDNGRVARLDNSNATVVQPVLSVPEPKGQVDDTLTASRPGSQPEKRSVGASVANRSEPRRGTPAKNRVAPRTAETRTGTTALRNTSVPRLNEFGEDEDTSLRLAELFEDIETSD